MPKRWVEYTFQHEEYRERVFTLAMGISGNAPTGTLKGCGDCVGSILAIAGYKIVHQRELAETREPEPT